MTKGEKVKSKEYSFEMNEILNKKFKLVLNTDYYKEAYPYSVYRCLDPEHKFINVTASALRNMPIKERKEWLA